MTWVPTDEHIEESEHYDETPEQYHRRLRTQAALDEARAAEDAAGTLYSAYFVGCGLVGLYLAWKFDISISIVEK